METIEVTVDKSHLITIGERLYGESIELIRELVNNTYDADATEVKITLKEDRIIVEDNGSGMDLEGLKQYFNIGSPLKRQQPKSPKFGRDRIGEFGIGKFSVLSTSDHFEVWTKKGNFQARIVFDKDEWESSKDRWRLPLFLEKPDPRRPDGTVVTLVNLRKRFDLQDVERRIIESCPIKAPDFSIWLNGRKITARFIPGQRIPFLEGTEYGIIHGEIVITPQSQSDMIKAGIECKVKQVTIKREFFGLEELGPEVARISGEVNADFLPLTSDRNDFIKDSPQYQGFWEVMQKIVERIKRVWAELSDYKENRMFKRRLIEVLERVKEALMLNPELCPEGLIPITTEESESIDEESEQEAKEFREKKPKKKRQKKPQVKRITPTAIIKKLKLGQQGITCCIDHFGPDGSECLTEGTVVYINRDHPLYQREIKSKEAYILYIARLLTQEISLMKESRNPRQAYERQSKLLKDALTKYEER
jgi:hypothetical protein